MAKRLEESDWEKFEKCMDMFAAGATIREVCLATGIALNTSAKIRTAWYAITKEQGEPEIKCPCGRLAGHSGRCSHRMKRLLGWHLSYPKKSKSPAH